VHVIGVADAEASVSRLIVEQNGSDFRVRWSLHPTAANVTSIVLVWCASRSTVHGCEVIVSLFSSLYYLIVVVACYLLPHSQLHCFVCRLVS